MSRVPQPPYMLGDRSAPAHGGDGNMSFRQVPYVSVSARLDKGAAVRKHLRKYLESSASSHQAMAHQFLSDAHVASMVPDEISKTTMDDVFRMLQKYNHTVGTKSLEVSKAFTDLAAPLDHSSKLKKWNKDTYNLVQKCVQDVATADKKMERAIARRNKAKEEHTHWRRVLEANKATLASQPNNPECMRAVNTSQAKTNAAAEEERIAIQDYEDAKSALHSAIEHRDDVVEESTTASQMVEEDRLDTMTLVLQQFVQAKQTALIAEMESLKELARVIGSLDRNAAIQQYIVDNMQPDITHRHSKALFLLEWHWKWHLDRIESTRDEPEDYLDLQSDSIPCLQESGITVFDVEVMKDFVASCFVSPDISRMHLSKIPSKHRHRFVDPKARNLYRLDTVRNVVVAALNHQRAHSQELTVGGYDMMVAALNLLLHGCMDKGDTKCAKSVMNMAQTFYCVHKSKQHYLLQGLVTHPLWQTAHFWGDAVLLSIGEELSRNPMDTPWYYCSPSTRASHIVTVHNVVFGQLTTFVYNMAAFQLSRRQIQQFVQNVSFSFELGEDQRMQLLATVASLDIPVEKAIQGGDAALFTTAIFPEWRKTPPPKDRQAAMHLVGQGLMRIKGIFDRDVDKASSQALLANAQKTNDQWQDLFGDKSDDSSDETKKKPEEQLVAIPVKRRARPKSSEYIEFHPPLPPSEPSPAPPPNAPPPPNGPHPASLKKDKKQRPRSTNNIALAEAAFGSKNPDEGKMRRTKSTFEPTGVAALRARFERMESS
ncbi:hypothetical protein Ae201684P_005116 [Aphanomyces euteiches]|uniref:SBF1/SBF2 domain-containing protein n=1 Tax=Aphanomyces euteiches TaxID=100861 RepID=A0A6G0X4I4_9STRA|nr:hypothetical protein Ae201684_008535 [Aphanomyces euteiches]KAH9085408.1 hypothetical protein Ae201684P_005116 [Aphanomyces euteiches]